MKLEEFIQEQFNERYKHFIIYGPPFQGKSGLARTIADNFSGVYIDLLSEFIHGPGKSREIDLFGPTKLIEFIRNYNHGNKQLLVIDQLDFLINTWDDGQFRELLAFVDMDQSDVCCIIFMQNYHILERENVIRKNDKGHNRQINIYNIRQGGTIDG